MSKKAIIGRLIFCTFVVTVVVLYQMSTSAADAAKKPATTQVSLKALRSSPAFQGMDTAMQGAFVALVEVATPYQKMKEAEILAIPEIKVVSDDSKSPQWEFTAADGTKTRFKYHREEDYLYAVTQTKANKESYEISFYSPQPQVTPILRRGTVIFPDPIRLYTLEFGANVATPTIAASVGAGVPGAYEGYGVAWDDDGNVIASLEPTKISTPYDVRLKLIEQMPLKALDDRRIQPKQRLMASPAYQSADPELKRQMDSMVGWAEMFVGLDPSQYKERLNGDEVFQSEEEEEEEETVTYRLTENKSDLWNIVLDKNTGKTKRAAFRDSTLIVYFDDEPDAPMRNGVVNYKEMIATEKTGSVISFYPGYYTPRMAIATRGPDATEVQVQGDLYVWDREGNTILSMKIESLTPLHEVLHDVEIDLTELQKLDMAWQGAEEESAWLLGHK